jgi:ribose transport system permease protein
MSDHVPTSTERPQEPVGPPAADAPETPEHVAPVTEPGSGKWALYASKYGLLGAFLLSILIFSLVRPDSFPTGRNAESILTLAAPSLIMAVGLTVVLVMQDFDLSFGAMIGLAGGAGEAFMVQYGWPWQVAVLAVIGLGILAGLSSGFMVAFLGGSSFIITLAMGTVLTGVEYALTNQNTVYQGFPQTFVDIASNDFLGLSNQIWIGAVIAILIWILLDRTEIGRYMYAIGGNPEAARLSGVRVVPLRILGFIIVGVTAAIVGLLLISQSGSYAPNGGTSYLLPTYAAVFLGAAVFRPGEFNVPGTIIGVLFLGVIQTGLIMLDLQTYVINLVQGGILITAVLISRLGARAA